MKTWNRVLLAPLGLLLAGCVPLTTQTRLSPTSPANPSAGEGAYPAAVPVLMTGNNYAMGPQAEGTAMDMGQHGAHPMKMPGHEGHEKTPAKPTKQDHQEPKAPKQ